jgi:hypothetical protein
MDLPNGAIALDEGAAVELTANKSLAPLAVPPNDDAASVQSKASAEKAPKHEHAVLPNEEEDAVKPVSYFSLYRCGPVPLFCRLG